VHDDPVTGPPPPRPDRPDVPAALDPTGIRRSSATGEDRSPNAWVCPFLRAIDDDDVLGRPVDSPDPANRCAALHDPVPQSLRQQELVCLTSGHVNCPRYLRGSIGAEPLDRARIIPGVRPATGGAMAVLVLAVVVSVGYVIANGGLVLTAAGSLTDPSGGVLGEIATPAPTAVPSAAPTPEPTAVATPTPTPSPSPTASPLPTASPTASPSPTAVPTPTPTQSPTTTPKPSSNRFALLTPCPSATNCYIYVIRSGDNLYSIANYFGVRVSSVESMNPWLSSGLKVGRELRIPTPTR